MPTKITTLEKLQELVEKFRDDRNWKPFHKPKDLAMAISIESSELLEHFLWRNEEQIEKYLKSEKLEEVGDEMSDVFIYLIQLASILKLNLIEISQKKMLKNGLKYPVEKSFGNSDKQPGIKG